MTTIVPTLGRTVWYRLNMVDVAAIRERRVNLGDVYSNPVREGDLFTAIIVKVWGDTPDAYVNLVVLLDGEDTAWVTSRQVGDKPGGYQWMPYQLGQAKKETDARLLQLAREPICASGVETPTPITINEEAHGHG